MRIKPLAAASAIAIAALAAAAPARAEGASPRNDVLFVLADRNNDGTIDRSEVVVLRAAIFDAVDLDHNGFLTRSEAMAVAERARAQVGDRIAAAIKAGPAAMARKRDLMAARLGLDKPGGLSRDDFIGRDAQFFAKADADASGTVSRAEFDAVAGVVGAALMPE